jgi:myo-inositol-1(or 4)-monophosphatase
MTAVRPADDRVQACRRLAVEAGRRAHSAFGRAEGLSAKGRHDEVTAMDREVERLLRQAIARAFPDDAVLGEEDGASAGLASAEHVWVIDPIDGTANYARGIAHYAISIGVLRRGTPHAAALHDPCHERLYWAARGGGAWLDEHGATRRLAVSAVDALERATVECGWSLRRPQADYLALVERMLSAGCAVRRAGSGALGLADVAAGRVEGYAELHINSWDCAAGVLLVEEAGGRVNDFFAGDGLVAGNPILATNAALAQALSAVARIPTKETTT